MTADDPAPNLFDELLDRSLRGAEIDAERVLAAHPELSAEERRLIRQLCGSSTTDAGAARAAPPGEAAEARLPASRIGQYRLVRRIGAGAMGAVFLAEDEALGRQVAIKILGPDLLGTGERSDRFLREVRAAARLRHPNIVTVHSAGEEDGLRYMVMELVPGRSLHEVMAEAAARGERVPVADVVRIGSETARALHAAHSSGIIHRDVKPSNIRIHDDGRAILLDFGLARDVGDATMTETGSFRGSPQYASPEQVDAGNRTIDAQTDLYSLGATLYELLTGVAPFRGESREQLFHAILTRDPVPLRRLDPAIPRDLETVVLAALEKDPQRRHPSAAALADDLDAVRDGRPVSVRPPSAAGRVARWARRHPARAALAAVLAIAVPAIAWLGGFVVANLPRIDQARAADRARTLADLLETAYIEFGEGAPDQAQRMFEEAVRADPASPEANAGLVLARMVRQDHEGAIGLLDGLPDPLKGSAWSGILRVEALRALKRSDEAKALEGSLPSPSTSADFFVRGYLELERVHGGEPDAAIRAFSDLRAADSLCPTMTPLYRSELGHAAFHAARNDEAKQIAASIEALRPESPERWFAVGRTLRRADRAAAGRALEKAARPPPRSLAARDFIVVALTDIEPTDARRKLASEIALEGVRLEPARTGAHYALGVARAAAGDMEGALASLREALRLRPANLDAATTLYEILSDLGDHEAALPAAKRLTKLAPRRKRSWDQLGIAMMNRGDYEGAIAAFETALRLAPDDPSSLCNLGTALVRGGRFPEALEKLRRGHDLGSKRSNWTYPSAKWVKDCERNLALEARRSEIRSGKGAPATAEEKLRIARHVCRPKRLFAEASDLYAAVFESDDTLWSRIEPDYALEAAAAGIHAATGRGADAPAAAEDRARLRDRVLKLLQAALAESEEIAGSAAPQSAAAAKRVAEWLVEPELAPVGPRSDFANIPPEEADSWRALWKRCEAIAPASRPASRPLVTR